MKTNTNRNLKTVASILVFLALSAFAPGGDSFTIFLNNELLVKQFVHGKEKTQTIIIDKTNQSDIIKVNYSHCGKIGESRSLILRDDDDKTIIKWTFDNNRQDGTMSVRAIDLATARRKYGKATLALVYFSKEIPNGFTLAYVSTDSPVKASAK